MNDSFSSLISSANSILVLLPSKPYFYQVAAGLSLYLTLKDQKPTTIFSSSSMTVGFNRLIGVDKISSNLGDKNLVIKFTNYDGNGIDKVKADLENGEFILTVIPKPGFNSPKKEQLSLSTAGVSADLLILIGGASDSHFPELADKQLQGVKILHIGTRVLTSDRGIMSFAKPGSSVSELIASTIKENGIPMDSDSATNLIMGIEEGSSHFESSEVTPETFEIFAHLLRNGGQRMPKTIPEPKSFPMGSIPTQPFGQKVSQVDPVLEQIEAKEEIVENPPQDWLQPKIYKGTSVS